jgi:hypothetical protein
MHKQSKYIYEKNKKIKKKKLLKKKNKNKKIKGKFKENTIIKYNIKPKIK